MLLLLLFISLDLLLIYCFDTFYLSINSIWLFLFPFLTGREWMAVARNGVSKQITSFVKPFLALLHSCILAFSCTRYLVPTSQVNNRSPKIDQSYPSLLLLT